MKSVSLLVTGKTEEVLHQSLKQVFPSVEFVMLPRQEGFTSVSLVSPPKLFSERNAPRPTNVERLVAALVAEVEPGRRDKKAPDLVVLIDDLELVNHAQPDRAVENVRTAMEAYVNSHPWPNAASRQRAQERVRERCSFHILSPMVEAYFFPESAALARAGAKRPSMMNASVTDVESFLVNEPAFLAPPNRTSKSTPPPWAIPDRARHPKSYLQFLCDPTGKEIRAYVETVGGQAALRYLDWNAVLMPPSHVCFVRSLIHDIADALGEHAVAQRFQGTTHPLTWPPPRNNLLRNI